MNILDKADNCQIISAKIFERSRLLWPPDYRRLVQTDRGIGVENEHHCPAQTEGL